MNTTLPDLMTSKNPIDYVLYLLLPVIIVVSAICLVIIAVRKLYNDLGSRSSKS